MSCCRFASWLTLVLAGFVGAGTAGRIGNPSYGADEDSPSQTGEQGHRQHAANHLAGETSPYLLLHAHNPVDWYPWGPEALEKAQTEGKPIFLSIGYSSCYWCHVMERESFSDEEIAAYLNEHFVCIKVDREERPDVDDIYMTALQVYYQAVGSPQGGGWPLSLFLTPDRKPMLGGTYFPPRSVQGRPGFLEALKQVNTIWSEHHDEIVGHADLIASEVRRIMQPVAATEPVPLDRSLVSAAVAALRDEYDPEYGGVDFDSGQPGGPKFPVPVRLMLLQSQIARGTADAGIADDAASDDVSPARMVDNTLDQMRRGGIFDHLGGGFHRYSTDRQWLVPHFEKMLYDNAQLAEVYAEAFRRTNRHTYRDVAERTYDFVLRELTDPRGAFYSALDAETDGVEGQFYVWSPEEVTAALGAEDAKLFMRAYGMNKPEFFEHGYVLHLAQTLDETADALDVPDGDLRDRLAVMREKLLAVRNERPRLLRDDKILTSWNGLMVRALAVGGDALGRKDLIDAAERAALFLLAELRDEDGRLLRTSRGRQSKLNAYLDDYAFLVDALLTLHKVTEKEDWLNAAKRLTDDQLDLFWDDAGHGFYFTSDDHEELLARTKNAYDSVVPSGNAVSVRNLTRLAQLTGEMAYRDRAAETLQVFASQLQQRPTGLTFMALALDEFLAAFGDVPEIAQAAAPSAEQATSSLSPLTSPAPSPGTTDDEPLIVAGRTNPRDKEAKVAAKVYLSVDKLPPGGEAEVAILLDIQEGWHINSNPSSDEFLVPTEVSSKSTLETTLTDISYPKGKSFRMAGFDDPISVYEGEVLLKGNVKALASAAGQTDKLQVSIGYSPCNDKTCLRPTEATLTLQLPIAGPGESPRPINQRLFRKDAAQP